MQYDFLKQFGERMKHVGLYAVVLTNSFQKQTWKQYGITKIDEQINFIFCLLLFIMEQSLKEENCTIDDICVYLDDINNAYFHKPVSYEECKGLAEFIINVVLCNEGREMVFDCFEPEKKEYKRENIRLISNRIIYLDTGVKRTSYYLTDEGYSLLLSTLEIENNMQLTIHEMIFKMHLDKQSYDRALEEVKRVFNSLKIQLQKIQESMLQIRRNALNYSTKDYESLQKENIETITDTKKRFQGYRDTVMARVRELEQKNINIEKLTIEEMEKMESLRQIESYLKHSIDEHQKILNSHFDLKILYEKQLELMSQMSRIRRVSFRDEIYEQVLKKPDIMDRLDIFFRPLFHQEPEAIYNVEKSFELQRPIRKKAEEDDVEIVVFDEAEYERELEAKKIEKLKHYRESLLMIFQKMSDNNGMIKLSELKAYTDEKEQKIMLPTVDIFKEIMVELLKVGHVSIEEIKKEKSEYIQDTVLEFRLQEMILEIAENEPILKDVNHLYVEKFPLGEPVVFEHVMTETGEEKTIRCSELVLYFEKIGEK